MHHPEEKPAGGPQSPPLRGLEASLEAMDDKRREALDLLRHDVSVPQAEEIGRALTQISGEINHARAVLEEELGENGLDTSQPARTHISPNEGGDALKIGFCPCKGCGDERFEDYADGLREKARALRAHAESEHPADPTAGISSTETKRRKEDAP